MVIKITLGILVSPFALTYTTSFKNELPQMVEWVIKEQEIINLFRTHYGLNVYSIQIISGGADVNAFAYKADTPNNSYFVKLRYGDYDIVNQSSIFFMMQA